MKNLSLLFIAILFIQFTSLAQEGWFLQNPYPTTSDLSGVDFIDELVGTSVGVNGTITSTVDGGDTWFLLTSGTTNDLNDFCLTNSDIGTAIGNEGTILRTTNGGEIWESQTSATVNDLYGVSFWDELTGIVVGADGTILTTTDGGINWIEQTSVTTYDLKEVCFISDSTAITVGERNFQEGIILRTTDIGVTWTEQANPYLQRLHLVCFADSLTGFAVGRFSVLIGTTDGGINWFGIDSLGESGRLGNAVNDICFIDSNIGYAAITVVEPMFSHDAIIKTTDSGITWNIQLDNYYPLDAICFTDSNNGTAVGDYGAICRTTDGGSTWNNQSTVTRDGLRDVCFADKYHGIVIGTEPPPPIDVSEIGSEFVFSIVHLRTSDGGNNWLQTEELSYHRAVSLADSNNAIAVGQEIISKTTDGGITWEHQDFPNKDFYGVSYPDINHAIVVGDIGIILHTTDGGGNWIEKESYTTNRLLDVCCFPSLTIAYAVGVDGTILSYDDGAGFWRPLLSGVTARLRAVSFGDFQHGCIVYGDGVGNILTTDFYGETWTQQTICNTELYDVCFTDPDNGTVVGEEGTILRTTDGGNTWEQQISGITAGLNSVCFTDSANGTIVGGGGIILRTTNGGLTFVEENEINKVISDYYLSNNFPNPFNPNTKVRYSVPQASKIVIKVFDILGNEVETLVNEEIPIGTYEITWYAEGLPSGVYFYRLQAGSFIETKKMVLLK